MSHRRSSEYRLIMTTAFGLCAAGAAGSVVPGLDTAAGAVLVVVGAAVVRRELRIRRRAADLDGLRYWPRPPGGEPETRVGPGEHAPVLPAPTDRPDRALTVVPADRPFTPSGGAA